jgi:cytochrome c oxidase cbb3-type subunit 3
MRARVVLSTMCVLIALGWSGIVLLDWNREQRVLRADVDAIARGSSLYAFASAAGRRQFADHCAVCHGPRGTGARAAGVPDLTDADWLYGTGAASEIERTIAFGIRSRHPKAWNLARMPAYASPQPSVQEPAIQPLAPREIDDVTEFLFQIRVGHADAALARRGAAIFQGKGGCYDCHRIDGTGDAAIGAPNLTDAVTLYGDGSRDAIRTSIAFGRQGVCPAWVKTLSPAAIRELALFVYSISHTKQKND